MIDPVLSKALFGCCLDFLHTHSLAGVSDTAAIEDIEKAVVLFRELYAEARTCTNTHHPPIFDSIDDAIFFWSENAKRDLTTATCRANDKCTRCGEPGFPYCPQHDAP